MILEWIASGLVLLGMYTLTTEHKLAGWVCQFVAALLWAGVAASVGMLGLLTLNLLLAVIAMKGIWNAR